ncbi:polysaccharide pyruvyl transferase family protein [Gordonia amicalis]|uniref:polysaccharide pyruvyl transferase family protein n=1 Tax=Gordonia amicalis TaxID=89053 RepID=UPI0022B4C1FF|nr:polysaccharide pyruvyl transferase family protein [Gordonia amicalis]MCZ4581840.1 polysaccharide pyruvyl transferase family protein [Gordonia amicalis]
MKVVVVSGDRTDESGFPQNIGDAYLTNRLATWLLGCGHEVTVLDLGSQYSTAAGLVRRDLKSVLVALFSADLLIVGGGTLLQDDQQERVFAGMPRLCLAARILGIATRTRVVYWGVGCEIVTRRRARWALTAATAGCDVHVRDEESQVNLVASIGKRAASISRDASLVGGKPDSPVPGSRTSENYVVVALAGAEAKELLPGDVRRVALADSMIVFVSMDQGEGSADVGSLPAASFSEFDHIVVGENANTIERWISGASVLVASRMHAMYIAALHSVPTVAVGRRTKIVQFANRYRIPRFDSIRDVAAIATHACSVDYSLVEKDSEQAESCLDKALTG